MRESLILFTAIGALAVPAVAIFALLMAYRTARRFDDLERRLHGLARELRALQDKPDRGEAAGGTLREDGTVGAGRSQPSSGSGKPEKRTYSLSFLEEEPDWKKMETKGEGAGDEPASDPEPVRKETGQSAGNRSHRRRRRKRRGNG